MLPVAFPATGLVAHRGLASRYPENTVEALEAAIAVGHRIVEFDLQMTADGVPVVLHDPTLERTAGQSASIMDLTLEAARQVAVGYPARFGGRFAEARISTLDELAATLAGHADVYSLVEVKRHAVERFGLVPVLDAVLAAAAPLHVRGVVISFVPAVVEAAAGAGWSTGLCLDDLDAAARATAERLCPDLLLVDEVHVHAAADLWPGPWRYGCWEVVDPDRTLQLLELGVPYVETMAGDRLFESPAVERALATRRH